MTLDFLLNYYIIYPIQVMHNICKDNITFGIAKIRITVSSPAMGDNTTQRPNLSIITQLPGEHHSSTTITITHTATCKKSIFFSFEVYGMGI
jgi:hypothetical protein